MKKLLLTALAFTFSASISASESIDNHTQTNQSIFKEAAHVKVLNAKEMKQTQAGAICFSIVSGSGQLRQICY